MGQLINLEIDGKEVQVPEGTLVVDAAKKIGVDIPAEHHIEEGWQVFARCVDGGAWSKL